MLVVNVSTFSKDVATFCKMLTKITKNIRKKMLEHKKILSNSSKKCCNILQNVEKKS
jgi:hypothetical protein